MNRNQFNKISRILISENQEMLEILKKYVRFDFLILYIVKKTGKLISSIVYLNQKHLKDNEQPILRYDHRQETLQ